MCNILKKLNNLSKEQYLEFLGIVEPSCDEAFKHYKNWLAQSKYAGMDYLKSNEEARKNPALVLPSVQSIIILAMNYNLGDKYVKGKVEKPRIAQYARFKDYHKILKKKGDKIIEGLKQIPALENENFRVVTDSAPILERHFAQKTHFGFIGKNTCYIHPQKGSLLLLVEILTTARLPTDEKTPVDASERNMQTGGCGSCQRCQVNCPTGALDDAYKLDANKCLSYWTIEHRGLVPEEYWPWFGDYWFGCDICQLVCPYNRKAAMSKEPDVSMVWDKLSLTQIAKMSQAEYEEWFGGTPMTRAKREGLRRNALLALWARKDPFIKSLARELSQDENQIVAKTALQLLSNLGQ